MKSNRSYRRHASSAHSTATNGTLRVLRQAFQSTMKTINQLTAVNIKMKQEKRDFVQTIGQIQELFENKCNYITNEISTLEQGLKAAQTNNYLEKKENERLQGDLNEVTAEEKTWRLDRDNIVTELKELQEQCKAQKVVMMKKDKLITSFRGEMVALTKENLSMLIAVRQKEDAHRQSEREWKTKCEALEVRLNEEMAEREQRPKEHKRAKKRKSMVGQTGQQDSGRDKHAVV